MADLTENAKKSFEIENDPVLRTVDLVKEMEENLRKRAHSTCCRQHQ